MVLARSGCRTTLRLGAAALAVVALAGCLPRPDDSSTRSPGGTPSSAAGTSSAGATTSAPVSPSGTGSTPVPTHTVAAKDLRESGGHLRLEIYALERSGEVVVLDFGVRNLGSEDAGLGKLLSKGNREYDVSGVYLYEPRSRLQHWPATVDGDCVCSTGVGLVPAGEVQPLSATYSPPEDGVDAVDVHVPEFGTLKDIPVSG